ncbi:hypothetical protein Ae201684_008099 [Aphanomyces euteiches]|uniref:Uncharacterized protein n=1 Tax=Aphanomyces euteiches TaxID=100861 RepID=A0A6G0X6F7_9STRA|nr:hypothetical protein Ae201684_008099 [Aphanomyces euteiches]
MASLLCNYPTLKSLGACNFAVSKLEQCANSIGLASDDLLRWSAKIYQPYQSVSEVSGASNTPNLSMNTIRKQEAIIVELIALNKAMTERMTLLETHVGFNWPQRTASVASIQDFAQGEITPAPKRRKSSPTSLAEVWLSWFARSTPTWSHCVDKKKKSEARQLVGFMKVFCAEDFTLNGESPTFHDDVLRCGAIAEQRLLNFTMPAPPSVKSSGSVLRILRQMHRAGLLDDRIRRFSDLVLNGRVADPTPIQHKTNHVVSGNL